MIQEIKQSLFKAIIKQTLLCMDPFSTCFTSQLQNIHKLVHLQSSGDSSEERNYSNNQKIKQIDELRALANLTKQGIHDNFHPQMINSSDRR